MLNEKKRFQSVELEALKFKIEKILPTIQEVDPKFRFDTILQQGILELQTKIWAECLQTKSKVVTHKFYSPRTWWQHLKKEKFPGWLLKKFPVDFKKEIQKTRIRFRQYAKFPSFNYKSDKRFEKFVIEETIDVKEILSEHKIDKIK